MNWTFILLYIRFRSTLCCSLMSMMKKAIKWMNPAQGLSFHKLKSVYTRVKNTFSPLTFFQSSWGKCEEWLRKLMSRSKADGALLFRTVYSVFIKTGIVWASSEMNSTSPSWLAVSVTRMRPVNIFLILSFLAIFICSTTLNISWSLSLSSVHRMAEKIYQTIAVFNSSIEQNIKKYI